MGIRIHKKITVTSDLGTGQTKTEARVQRYLESTEPTSEIGLVSYEGRATTMSGKKVDKFIFHYTVKIKRN